MNTMIDLRRVVAKKMRETLHGREIDHFDKKFELEHMIGIVDVGESASYDDLDGTLLDENHEFWQEWHSDVGGYSIRKLIQRAIQSLADDGILQISYPKGEEAEISYIEVSKVSPDKTTAPCVECGSLNEMELSLERRGFSYAAVARLDCESCGERGTFERDLVRS